MPGPRKSPQEHEENGDARPGRLVGGSMNLETPVLLVAMPQVLDPFFHMSVVLLIQHQSEGSQGFIVNRPTGVAISDILEGLNIQWGGDREEAAHFGGPVQPQIGTVIYRRRGGQTSSASHHEIYPGVLLTQNIHDLQTLAENPPGSMRLFLGYAGWGEGQLMQEILRNDWITAPVAHDLVFASKPGETWRRALLSVGVDPNQLPTWTPADADGVAN